MAVLHDPKLLVDGLIFPESPRWHDNKLWFVDMFAGQVLTSDLEGKAEVMRQFDDRPSGIGFLPDGSAIVTLMAQKKVVRIDNGEIHADLSDLGGDYLNDMVVDPKGRAFVDYYGPRPPDEGSPDAIWTDAIITVEPNGDVGPVTRGDMVRRPNGVVITPDGMTLIAAMPPLRKLISFSIGDDGSLSKPEVFASTDPDHLDGICLDAEGAIWVASPRTNRFLRIRSDGRVTDTIPVEGKWAIACMLGGPQRKTLFLATAHVPENPRGGMDGNLHESKGYIEMVDVEVPGAGLP